MGLKQFIYIHCPSCYFELETSAIVLLYLTDEDEDAVNWSGRCEQCRLEYHLTLLKDQPQIEESK